VCCVGLEVTGGALYVTRLLESILDIAVVNNVVSLWNLSLKKSVSFHD
jgi:hypothetical protein